MSFRRIVFWSHLAVGVAIGLVVLSLSVTGVLLTYERQIRQMTEPIIPVERAGAPSLPAGRLVEIALTQTGGRAMTLTFSNDPTAPVSAGVGRHKKILLDPYSGDVLDNETGVDGFFRAVTHFHRWFALSGSNRATGAAITGAANLAFLFLLLSGLYLWWPKSWKWRIVKMNLLFRRGLPSAKARDFNWHHVFGIWALAPLFLVVVSGVVISYDWASALVYNVYGEETPMRRGPPGRAAGDGTVLLKDGVDLQHLIDSAKTHDAAWKTVTLHFPGRPGAKTADVTVDTGNGLQLDRKTTLTFARSDGSLVKTTGVEAVSPGRRARMFLRFLHTGEIYGVVGQTIAGLASLAAIFMVYTGLALAYRRLVRPLLTRKTAAHG